MIADTRSSGHHTVDIVYSCYRYYTAAHVTINDTANGWMVTLCCTTIVGLPTMQHCTEGVATLIGVGAVDSCTKWVPWYQHPTQASTTLWHHLALSIRRASIVPRRVRALESHADCFHYCLLFIVSIFVICKPPPVGHQ